MFRDMWLAIFLPTLDSAHSSGRLAKLHGSIGCHLQAGDVLADVTIDLSAGVARDCPPVSTCRIVLQEAAWLREVLISSEGDVAGGSVVALMSTDPDEPPEPPARRARITVASILHHEEWWAPLS